MSSAKTNWEDLARLGWPKRQVFLTLNAKRGGTMKNESHLHLNDSFVDQYGWYCYNVVTGQAKLVSSRPVTASETVVRHTWNNTENNRPQKETWQETVTRSSTTSLTTTSSSVIELKQSITIANVAESGMSLTISTESKQEESHSETEQITRTFEIEVGPHEKLELLRTKTQLGQVATYHVPYGLSGDIGTQGDKYNGHYHWGYDVNYNLNRPSGNIELMGVSNVTDYSFTMRRTGGQGAVKSKVMYISPVDAADNVELEINDGERQGDDPLPTPGNQDGIFAGF